MVGHQGTKLSEPGRKLPMKSSMKMSDLVHDSDVAAHNNTTLDSLAKKLCIMQTKKV